MNRRNMLRVLPLAAMVGATVKLGERQATAYEMKPDKKYLFVVPGDISADQALTMRMTLQDRGINSTICCGEDLKIYELE